MNNGINLVQNTDCPNICDVFANRKNDRNFAYNPLYAFTTWRGVTLRFTPNIAQTSRLASLFSSVRLSVLSRCSPRTAERIFMKFRFGRLF
jgi:hypothetical protein